MNSPFISINVWGEYALFSRPELRVERLSYPMMTPSAARGVLDAILFKPQMYWHVRRIIALRPFFPPDFPASSAEQPYRLISVRRNEIQGKIAPRTVEGWAKNPASAEPYLVDSAGRGGAQGQNRTQRNSLILQHVAYRIDASPLLSAKANRPREVAEDGEDRGPDSVAKYVAMFQRRVAKGQCYHRPYLGCREFACQFGPTDESATPLRDWNERLGMMLYDIQFGPDGINRPGFFDAEIKAGVLHCDTAEAGLGGEPPVTVHGWEGGAE